MPLFLRLSELFPFADELSTFYANAPFLIGERMADPVGFLAMSTEDGESTISFLIGDDDAESNSHIEYPEHFLFFDFPALLK